MQKNVTKKDRGKLKMACTYSPLLTAKPSEPMNKLLLAPPLANANLQVPNQHSKPTTGGKNVREPPEKEHEGADSKLQDVFSDDGANLTEQL